jgi:FecR protein
MHGLRIGMMYRNPRLFRLSATVAMGALLCNTLFPVAVAQPAPPPPVQPAQSQPDPAQADPPARVGRIASQSGAVSFRTSADTQWSAATPNYPVSAGNAFWTEPTARANLEISASSVSLNGQTELDISTLDDSGLQAVAPQGEAYFHLNLAPNEIWSVETPRGTARLTQSGRYDIVVGTTDQPTTITVVEGAAELEGPGVSLKLAANQTATITGSGPFEAKAGPIERDAFLSARISAEHPPTHAPTSIPAQLSFMSGAEDLSGTGEWSQSSDYGQVWYPPVASNWVPYRDGDWAYVAPWGWTWVDSAPWGFAPFHYGRWAQINNRWGWVPGGERDAGRPVYAPALVTFIGLSAGVAVGAALAHGSVGWVPLGPREAYHPWYHASSNYERQINRADVKEGAPGDRNPALSSFANRSAATSVPAGVMMGSRPVRAAARPVPAQAFASAHAVIGEQPIRPTAATFGVTPAVAHQLNLTGTTGARHPAPGPVVRAQAEGPSGGQASRPALLGPHGEQPGASRPGEVNGRSPGGPGAGSPPIPTPETRPAGVPGSREARPGTEPPASGSPPGGRPENGPDHGPGGAPPVPPAGEHRPGEQGPGAQGPGAQGPGAQGPAAPGSHDTRPPAEPAAPPRPGARPEGAERPAPGGAEHAPGTDRPEGRPPGRPEAPHEQPPRSEAAPHPAAAPPHAEAPPTRAAAPPPHVEAPPPRPAAPPPPAPHVEAPPPRPAAPPPPPPHVEAPHPAAPPPHAEPPRAAPAPHEEKRPG